MSDSTARRPGILNAVALSSILLSFLNVVWIAVIAAVAAIAGVAGWLLGPVVGALGSLVAALVILVLVLQSILSVLLFAAGWKTWGGDPGGRPLHLAWAWTTVVLDLVDLAFTAGIDGGAWIRLIYAIGLIMVMNRDDVRAYFDHYPGRPSQAKPAARDDWS
ncbi:hypothetical protein [Tautonia plasticadhaerens]|uniref:Uncharacterized protein n=1 Tax=Tautonia plasticadhaerens TaxID=2527974 RepID=A0A518H791_9BACT|nr:hypothetical protein [Tautonia plasticadhaerens]QDV36702.1 hypothetical protein ElP_46310 [Tautonia plasticadhaerens]